MYYKGAKAKLLKDLDDVKSIVKYTEEIFEEYWKKKVPYGLHRLKKMESKKIGIPNSLNKVLLYAKALNDVIDMHSDIDNKLNKAVINEVAKMEQATGYCIHISVLVKTLMDAIDSKESKKIQYYQGFSTLLTEDPLAEMMFGKKQIGIHAWLSYENAVMDVTSIQHRHSIQLPDNKYEMVIGEIPKSYLLHGFKENESIIVEYQKLFAEKMNLNKEQWIELHVKAFEDFMSN